jgi:hypothetical protein
MFLAEVVMQTSWKKGVRKETSDRDSRKET